MPPELTDWFPPHIKPVHVGPYQTCVVSKAKPGYSFWSGQWGLEFATKEAAMRNYDLRGGTQRKSWRGLAADPHLPAADRADTAVPGPSVASESAEDRAPAHG